LSSAPTPAWVITLTGALLLVVYAALEGPAVQPTATSDAGDRIWQVIAVLAVIFVLWMVFSDDDTPASATETAQAAPTTETISTPLSFGDSGPDVVNLQERLAAEGLPVTADGVYGPETADAVLAFQEQEQLTVDGVVGSETAEALGISSG
jgi:Putative peptidoglycan binding domain